MTRKRRFAKVQLNTSLIMDTGISALIVQVAPDLINQYFMGGNPLTGTSAKLAGVGAAYLYGMLMKNSNVANIGIALGAVEIIRPMLQGLLPGGSVSDYTALQEYTNDPSKRLHVVQYQDSY